MTKTINGVEYTTFEPNKTITELGIDTTRKFIVVNRSKEYCSELKEGDIVVLEEDDGSRVPFFRRISDRKTGWLYLGDLAYYEEPNHYYGVGIAEELIKLEKEREEYNKLNTTQPETKCSGGKTIMSRILNFAKDMVISKEDKELRKADLKDENLSWTDEARILLTDLLLEDNKARLVELAENFNKEQ